MAKRKRRFMAQMPQFLPKVYIKKSIPIRALQMDTPFMVRSKEGFVKGKKGDWLMEGVCGELYICDNGIFKKSYERIKGGER